MKSKLIIVLSILCGSVIAQDFKVDYKTANKVWLGIDYTAAKFVGRMDFQKPLDIMSLMPDWNNFVYSEPSKYDLNTTFQTTNIKIELNQVTQKNAEIDPFEAVSDNDFSLDESEAKAIALGYDFSEIDGIAILLVAESYNKRKLEGSYWLVLIDAKTKEFLFVKRYASTPKGFGLKNYWARTFYNALNLIQRDVVKIKKQ
jgi:hypothetical protein